MYSQFCPLYYSTTKMLLGYLAIDYSTTLWTPKGLSFGCRDQGQLVLCQVWEQCPACVTQGHVMNEAIFITAAQRRPSGSFRVLWGRSLESGLVLVRITTTSQISKFQLKTQLDCRINECRCEVGLWKLDLFWWWWRRFTSRPVRKTRINPVSRSWLKT